MNINDTVMDNIDYYLEEDLGKEGDITSYSLFDNEKAIAKIVANEDCIVAGLQEVKTVFEKTGAETELLFKDGDFVK